MTERPWSKRAEELRETEHDACDIVAWREWLMSRLIESDGPRGISHQQYGHMLFAHSTGEVELYSAFCEAIDHAIAASGRGETQ